MRVEHCRLIDMLLLSRYRRFNREQLNVDVRHIHSRALNGKRSYVAGLNAVPVDEAGDLNARVFGKVRNKVSRIENVAAYLISAACDDVLHNSRSVFV